MGEAIKPDYSLSFRREWFAKIWNGEKTIEYRRVIPKYQKRRRERRHGADGKMTASAKRSQIREKLIPRWKRVVFDGRDEAYMRRTTPENARLFVMWRDNPAMFEQMIKSSYQVSSN